MRKPWAESVVTTKRRLSPRDALQAVQDVAPPPPGTMGFDMEGLDAVEGPACGQVVVGLLTGLFQAVELVAEADGKPSTALMLRIRVSMLAATTRGAPCSSWDI